MDQPMSALSAAPSRRSSASINGSPGSPPSTPPSSPGAPPPQIMQQNTPSVPMDGKESVLRFLLLPNHVFVVLLLEFLNSFRSFGLRFVLYNYITNEFGVSDTRAGALLGVKGFVDIVFGLAGSIMVDFYGVRRVSLAALAVAVVGRSLLAFGRTEGALYLALFFFSPCGDALLSVGLYKVALKKLTTPLTRPLAFAMSYASFNLAGAFADLLVDKMRSSLEDVTIDEHFVGVAGVYTPLRQFIVVTWAAVLCTFLVAYCFLEDWTVIDMNDPEDDDVVSQQYSCNSDEEGVEYEGQLDMSEHIDEQPARPMMKPHLLRRCFPNHYHSLHHTEEETPYREDNGEEAAARRFPNYRIYRTKFTQGSDGDTSVRSGLVRFGNQVCALLQMRATWRVLIFGFASFTIAMGWTASEMILPPFLERRFGEKSPIYIVQSINLIGCLILPPIVGAMTSGREDFSIVMPGLWIMATSPILVALMPNVFGASLWQIFMTIGEVLWSPRQVSWTASLAPTGSEGLFFAVSSARSIMGPLTDIVMGAINERYNTNCPECRDQYGHFCDQISMTQTDDGAFQCSSVQESCELFLGDEYETCPLTCLECPTWEPTNPSASWLLLMLASLFTPLAVWFFLPFLRGKRDRGDKCYGLAACNCNRLLGICGVAEEPGSNQHRVSGSQLYGHVRNESFESSSGSIKALGEDVELT